MAGSDSGAVPGAFGGLGGFGGRGTSTARSVMVSWMVQVNGGRLARMLLMMISSTDSTAKRLQLMPTSQFA